MGEIIIKVPGDINEIIEVSDYSVVNEILKLKKRVPRKGWKEKFKEGEKELLMDEIFTDEDLSWWKW